jgi:hypothetical protein
MKKLELNLPEEYKDFPQLLFELQQKKNMLEQELKITKASITLVELTLKNFISPNRIISRANYETN